MTPNTQATSTKSIPVVCCKTANNCIQQNQNASPTASRKIGQRLKQEMFWAPGRPWRIYFLCPGKGSFLMSVPLYVATGL